ncbi:MAG: PQQ-dependent dehydrogenase, methanol/ethanol family, partial [Gammaproteobacteria bacterium]|nr:PQQ-dependent dehydrogenase, methanol/ethanol family [Gammaproteobacteria bacterium]
LVHAGRNGYIWLLEPSADGIEFVDAWPYVYQDVFTSIDPQTGRPSYDPDKTPGTGKPATYCPSLSGGNNWPPAAYSPQTGYLYIPANENLCTTLEGEEEVIYRPGQRFMGVDIALNVREGADHIGELQAWNLSTGERAWTHEFELNNWGPVLATAGGLLFMGGTPDRNFRA